VVAQPASRLEERTSRGPSRHTLVWTNATLVWPNNDMLMCALRRGGLGNGTQSDQHHEEAYEKADPDEEHLDDRRWRISRQGHDE